MSFVITTHVAAPPEVAWPLLAEPRRWSEWAPQLRGATGLGEPEVEAGAVGAARLLGGVAVPARIVSVDQGRAWTWRVGPATIVHALDPARGGCVLRLETSAPPGIEQALRVTYGPVMALLARNFARVAARGAA